ncbi:hypothetical protein [Amycolatopsis sp. lyj-84]|uniref:hypothetical protein n=1 Tax=Amycolatopsis sp. lyj-84 TaxID=2789284 RepID=UPI00397C61B3
MTTDEDGSGKVSVTAKWPDDAQAGLTKKFQSCVDELWAALDSLVSQALSMYSAVRRVRRPENPRFFPMADSAEGLSSLLQENCLDGIPNELANFVIRCQPFWDDEDSSVVLALRTGLKGLMLWTELLHDGRQIGAWATPSEPELFLEKPLTVARIETGTPGEVAPDKVLARFTLSGYTKGAPFSVNPNSVIDISFPSTPPGTDGSPNSLDATLNEVIRTVTAVITVFEQVTDDIPVAQAIFPAADNLSAWIEAGRSARAWTEQELSDLAQSDSGIGIVTDDRMSTFLVRTDQGIFERTIPDATELSPYAARGYAAERAARNAAATWGLPDFILSPTTKRKGRGVREISDGLIVVGDRGLVTQVKSRDAEPGTSAKERTWLDKKIAAAARQVGGTVRELATATVTMTNGRGRPIDLDGSLVTWTGVVIIDHPTPPADYQISFPSQRIPIVVLIRRDWEFLFQHLRSTRAVLEYLARVETSTTHLGGEPARYYELAADDAAATPGPPAPHLGPIGSHVSASLLPTAPAGSDDDEAHGLVRIICEDIAHSPLHDKPEHNRITILASIDSLPVGHRTDLGRYLLDSLAAIANVNEGTIAWRSRIFRSTDGPQLGFAVCSKYDEATSSNFKYWMLLRHHELWERLGTPTHFLSVGVLLTPRHDGLRDWDTSLLSVIGDPCLTGNELEHARRMFNNSTQ